LFIEDKEVIKIHKEKGTFNIDSKKKIYTKKRLPLESTEEDD